jgi:hypothetical protein
VSSTTTNTISTQRQKVRLPTLFGTSRLVPRD